MMEDDYVGPMAHGLAGCHPRYDKVAFVASGVCYKKLGIVHAAVRSVEKRTDVQRHLLPTVDGAVIPQVDA
jgi:hypothetical protein